MRPGPNGFMMATFKGEAEKEVEVATVLWQKSLESKPKLPKRKAKGKAKAKAKGKKAAKKRAAKKPAPPL